MTVRILVGDCRESLAGLEAGSVQCCVTSPPYFGLRDYGHPGQLGLESTPAEYVERMVGVFREVRRVLRDDGTLWLNIGDSYHASQSASVGASTRSTLTGGGGRYRAGSKIEKAFDEQRPTKRENDGTTKPKDLIGIPWMLAFALRADGWYLRSDIIWHKPNPMPESVTDRPTKSHEYLFLLSKSERYFYDAEAIAEAGAGRETFGNSRRPEKSENPDRNDSSRRDMTIIGQRNRRSVWTIATQPYSGAHFATFPPALIEPCIKAGSSDKACEHCGKNWERQVELGPQKEGAERGKHPSAHRSNVQGPQRSANGGLGTREVKTLGFAPACDCGSVNTVPSTILDPFGGAGTTGLVADRLGRNAILCELNPEYAELARKRIHSDNPLFTDVA